MEDLILNNIYLILLLPLWIFLVIMIGRFFAVYVNNIIVYFLTLFSSMVGGVVSSWLLYTLPTGKVFEYQLPFIKINDFIIPFGIYIDKVSLIFAVILFTVSFFVQLFSINCMKEEKKKYRFYGLINLFNFSLAVLFFSPNLYQSYVFWEIAGVVSYLLIGFEYFKNQKSIAAKRVFIINRIGDTALIAGIILCSYFMFEYAPAKSLAALSYMDINIISPLLFAYTSKILFIVICVLFILSAIVKSAQLPFYMWLQDAMEAKIPVSALLHSATLVVLGIYILIRVMPLLTLTPSVLKLISIVGILTALICSCSACAQNNPKRTLAYSTSAQIGLMFFALGCLNIKAAVLLLCAHAYIKSMLFLTLPKQDEKWDYFSFISFMIGGFSLSGIVFSGLPAKELLLLNQCDNGIIIVSLISFLTAFYISKIGFYVAEKHGLENVWQDKLKIISIFGLLALNILLYVYLKVHYSYKIAEPFWSALFGWIISYVLYTRGKFVQIPILYELCFNGFYADKLLTKVSVSIYNFISGLCKFIDEKIFDNHKCTIAVALAAVKTVKFVEENVMNKSVDIIKKVFQKLSETDLKLQSGNVQRYNLYALMLIAIISVGLVMAYSVILSYFGG